MTAGIGRAAGLGSRITGILLGLALLGLGSTARADGSGYSAEIRRTAFGIPHIRANDFGGLGYGQGYAFAQDNLCILADHFVTLRGERSKYFGADGVAQVAMARIPNPESDAFFRTEMDLPGLRAGAAGFSADYGALVRGFLAGYNRYLRDTPPDKRPAACRNAAWVQPATLDDFLRLNEEKMIQGGSGRWLRQAVAARHAGQRVAVVTHGGVLDMIYRHAQGLSLSGPRTCSIPNGGINRVVAGPEGLRISDWADVRHLDGLGPQPVYDQVGLARRKTLKPAG